ncbi:methylmalonyl-CoA epimerase [Lentilactobacillus senioris DSM 24302 = JCM 17472]|uniref:Methylmalonyl-CoA epimerase n=1 Tax=Lentilactobacillus senioris DSM 24302 = JCM 17472 TaxID=1423802 RepID=A0A0R2CRB1_9LACO|nr:VOC family protein [Lentilactobacillus senioris]KRM94337.1 methylmalonyl-CoA epimerase [Lentilactobacillus senioris DSM 24302 = JCM 17472]
MSITDQVTDLQHVGIPTADLAATIKFYEGLRFQLVGQFKNGAGEVAFLRFNHLTIETWTGDPVVHQAGAINHISLDTRDAQATFDAAQEAGYKIVEEQVQELPFWEHGIKYFNILGPNDETIEFCEIIK